MSKMTQLGMAAVLVGISACFGGCAVDASGNAIPGESVGTASEAVTTSVLASNAALSVTGTNEFSTYDGPVTQSWTLTNTSASPVLVTGHVVDPSSTTSSGFSTTAPRGYTLSPNQSMTFEVAFRLPVLGFMTEKQLDSSLVISSGAGTLTIPLTGNAGVPACGLQPLYYMVPTTQPASIRPAALAACSGFDVIWEPMSWDIATWSVAYTLWSCPAGTPVPATIETSTVVGQSCFTVNVGGRDVTGCAPEYGSFSFQNVSSSCADGSSVVLLETPNPAPASPPGLNGCKGSACVMAR